MHVCVQTGSLPTRHYVGMGQRAIDAATNAVVAVLSVVVAIVAGLGS